TDEDEHVRSAQVDSELLCQGLSLRRHRKGTYQTVSTSFRDQTPPPGIVSWPPVPATRPPSPPTRGRQGLERATETRARHRASRGGQRPRAANGAENVRLPPYLARCYQDIHVHPESRRHARPG